MRLTFNYHNLCNYHQVFSSINAGFISDMHVAIQRRSARLKSRKLEVGFSADRACDEYKGMSRTRQISRY